VKGFSELTEKKQDENRNQGLVVSFNLALFWGVILWKRIRGRFGKKVDGLMDGGRRGRSRRGQIGKDG
jgi:hypothetical protein